MNYFSKTKMRNSTWWCKKEKKCDFESKEKRKNERIKNILTHRMMKQVGDPTQAKLLSDWCNLKKKSGNFLEHKPILIRHVSNHTQTHLSVAAFWVRSRPPLLVYYSVCYLIRPIVLAPSFSLYYFNNIFSIEFIVL